MCNLQLRRSRSESGAEAPVDVFQNKHVTDSSLSYLNISQGRGGTSSARWQT